MAKKSVRKTRHPLDVARHGITKTLPAGHRQRSDRSKVLPRTGPARSHTTGTRKDWQANYKRWRRLWSLAIVRCLRSSSNVYCGLAQRMLELATTQVKGQKSLELTRSKACHPLVSIGWVSWKLGRSCRENARNGER
jgi:hypothetical protein